MSNEERKQILQMVADGKISAEEAAQLMRALDEPAEENAQIIPHEPSFQSESGEEDPTWKEKPDAPEFEKVKRRAFALSQIPLWLGALLVTLSAWGMFAALQSAGMNFWFFCLTAPLTLGVLLIALGAGGKSSRWLYLNVERSNPPEGGPRRITLALPLPLGLVAWFLRNFGEHIQGLKRTSIDEVVSAIEMTKSVSEPLIVHVDEGEEGGERVQIFIG